MSICVVIDIGGSVVVENNHHFANRDTHARPDPKERIDRRALPVWRLTGAVNAVIVCLVAAALTIGVIWLDLPWGPLIAAVVIAFALGFSYIIIVVVPAIRWRRWRYEVSEREIYLKHGLIVIKRTLIPMVRVQHVDTEQGPFLRRYGLATVSISTAAGLHEIPALSVVDADALRDRIAELARVSDDV